MSSKYEVANARRLPLERLGFHSVGKECVALHARKYVPARLLNRA